MKLTTEDRARKRKRSKYFKKLQAFWLLHKSKRFLLVTIDEGLTYEDAHVKSNMKEGEYLSVCSAMADFLKSNP